jgi:hypothetical protein
VAGWRLDLISARQRSPTRSGRPVGFGNHGLVVAGRLRIVGRPPSAPPLLLHRPPIDPAAAGNFGLLAHNLQLPLRSISMKGDFERQSVGFGTFTQTAGPPYLRRSASAAECSAVSLRSGTDCLQRQPLPVTRLHPEGGHVYLAAFLAWSPSWQQLRLDRGAVRPDGDGS